MDNKFSVALVTCVSSGILVIESLSFDMETDSVVVILNGVVAVSDVVVSVSSVFVSSSDALTTLVVGSSVDVVNKELPDGIVVDKSSVDVDMVVSVDVILASVGGCPDF